MSTHRYTGGCDCGNIRVDTELTIDPASYQPRACDCSFCRKHGAAYVTDANGKVAILVKDNSELRKHRNGSELADFLICKRCGVLVGGLYQDGAGRYATINVNSIDANEEFGQPVPVSPKTLSAEQKKSRWKELWFSDVTVTGAGE
ncbi:MAG: aldehyde-activating protein [Betaproteobacteria bacterium]|nr:MAG: aldehyde-activating protein [Betaproteobacteria bacterium]